MPLVTISIPAGKSDEYRNTVADTVNTAVLDTLDFPPSDRYQLIQELPPQDLELQDRDGDRAVLELTMRVGQARVLSVHISHLLHIGSLPEQSVSNSHLLVA